MTFLTKTTLAGITTASKGSAKMIYRVLKMFHSCDITPLRNRLSRKVIAKPEESAPSKDSAVPSSETKSERLFI